MFCRQGGFESLINYKIIVTAQVSGATHLPMQFQSVCLRGLHIASTWFGGKSALHLSSYR